MDLKETAVRKIFTPDKTPFLSLGCIFTINEILYLPLKYFGTFKA